MTDPMSRIPLSREEELTIGSMSRWMRFMSVVGICGALFMMLLVVLASGVFSAVRTVSLASTGPQAASGRALMETIGKLPYAAAALFLLFAAIAIWQNMALFHAGDDFNLVATTDTADVEYLSRGFDRLRTFFKIQVLTVAVTFTLVFFTAAVAGILAAHTGAAR